VTVPHRIEQDICIKHGLQFLGATVAQALIEPRLIEPHWVVGHQFPPRAFALSVRCLPSDWRSELGTTSETPRRARVLARATAGDVGQGIDLIADLVPATGCRLLLRRPTARCRCPVGACRPLRAIRPPQQ